MTAEREFEVAVVGGGPAGVAAAIRSAELGARTVLVCSGGFGGMAADDGPAPVRTLAHAARLMREARQLPLYGVEVGPPRLDYRRLLQRVSSVVQAVRDGSALRAQAEAAGVVVEENAGRARFVDPHGLETPSGLRLRAGRIILCPGGVSRPLDVPGGEMTVTHSDAWSLTEVPASMLVIGAGATGAQVASVFSAFGAQVQLFQVGPRILPTEEPEVSAAVAQGFRASGMQVHEGLEAIEGFEPAPGGLRMSYRAGGRSMTAEATLAVRAIGWRADTSALDLEAAGVATDARGFITVDATLRTSAPHIFAAGDVTGGLMLTPQALQAGFVAGGNAASGAADAPDESVNPVGSFTDPEYASVGLGEARARAGQAVEVVVVPFAETTRCIIDGRTAGFCKLIVGRDSHAIVGCHLVGDRAVDIVQLAAVAMAGGMSVEKLARLPLSFPTYAGVLARAAAAAAYRLNRAGGRVARMAAAVG